MQFKQPVHATPLALIVDDELSLRLSMKAAFVKAGFEIIEAENGREAISLFQSRRPDIILMDVVMPEMDGFEACAAIRNLPGGKYVQIVMVTGMDDTESTARAFEAGANDFVSKPINWVMLGHRGRYMLRASRAFQELAKNNSRVVKTQEIAKLGNWEINLLDHTFECSREAARLLGAHYSTDPVTFEEFLAPIVSHEREMVRKEIEQAVELTTPFSVNYRVIQSDGTQRYISNHAEVLYGENGEAELIFGAVQDVTELRQAEEEIHRLGFYDGLTGLANRMLFLDRLKKEVVVSQRNSQFFALLYLDLDQFKRVNDSFGHHVGDLLLKAVSEILKKSIRNSDTNALFGKKSHDTMVARMGGDEFTILLSNIGGPENAAVVARRIVEALSITYHLDEHEVLMTTSVGISVFPVDSREPEMLMQYADAAMYQAKDAGRNNYQFYDKSLNQKAVNKYNLEYELRQAVKKNELVLYYQPQIELATGRIVGAEALIRWLHPTKGMVPPDQFIAVAEETGIIVDINEWVIRTACSHCAKWSSATGQDLRVAVNLSGYKFAEQDFVRVIDESLQATGLEANQLEVEITENVMMGDGEETVGLLAKMRDLHVRVSLDDFGTGYSSLSYLTTFPVDTIKIDRSFVMGHTSEKKNSLIIKAIVALGHSLGLKIIAEGIETAEQLELLREYKCDEGQGYYFKHPLPQKEFMKLLSEEGLTNSFGCT